MGFNIIAPYMEVMVQTATLHDLAHLHIVHVIDQSEKYVSER